MIRFTELPSGKWTPLIHLDEIKERNKIENNDEHEFRMPFYLDLQNKDEVKKKMEDEFKDSIREKSKIIKE